jgi:hypothetical protein
MQGRVISFEQFETVMGKPPPPREQEVYMLSKEWRITGGSYLDAQQSFGGHFVFRVETAEEGECRIFHSGSTVADYLIFEDDAVEIIQQSDSEIVIMSLNSGKPLLVLKHSTKKQKKNKGAV